MTEVEQVSPEQRKAFLRDGALNAMWQAWSTHLAIRALEEAERDDAGLPPDKLMMRRQFLNLSKKFLEVEQTKQMKRALEELNLWDGLPE